MGGVDQLTRLSPTTYPGITICIVKTKQLKLFKLCFFNIKYSLQTYLSIGLRNIAIIRACGVTL